MAGDSTAGVVKNIGDCIPRYTILTALNFLYKTDVLMALVYVLIFLGKVIFYFIIFGNANMALREAYVWVSRSGYKNAPLRGFK